MLSPEALEEHRRQVEFTRQGKFEIRDGAIYEVTEGARLHFIKFETRQIEKCLDYVRNTLMMSKDFETEKADHATDTNTINVTGGGAFKFSDLISEKLGLKVGKMFPLNYKFLAGVFLLTNALMNVNYTTRCTRTVWLLNTFSSSRQTTLYPQICPRNKMLKRIIKFVCISCHLYSENKSKIYLRWVQNLGVSGSPNVLSC